ncbi:YfiM family protein [Crocinitomicaceae bacterium]|nr:YfiM family protein [Crocinitomicaceae bacterium]
MLKLLTVLLLSTFSMTATAQDSISISPRREYGFFEKATSPNKNRIIGVSSSVGSVWAGSMIALQTVWYADGSNGSFQFFDDSRNWLQMDKIGHVYTAYQLNGLTSDLYQWSGVNQKTSTWIGFGVSMGYQTTLEVLDGFSGEWGWSWADFASNMVGSSLYTAQELLWKEQRILPKFSYSPSPFAEIRPEVLGSSFTESLLKDYNGQTYWLSFSPARFLKNSKIPKWACFSFGYSAHEKLVGSEPTYLDASTGITYNEQREFLFSLDIDFSQIPIKRPWLKAIVKQLNYLKIPFPTVMLRDGKLVGSPFYF